MGSETFRWGIVFPTVSTAEGFLICVAELVFPEVTELIEPFPAAGAPVPSLSDLWLPPGGRGNLGRLGRVFTLSLGQFGRVGRRMAPRSGGHAVKQPRFSSQTGAGANRRRSRKVWFVCQSVLLFLTVWVQLTRDGFPPPRLPLRGRTRLDDTGVLSAMIFLILQSFLLLFELFLSPRVYFVALWLLLHVCICPTKQDSSYLPKTFTENRFKNTSVHSTS